MTPPGEVVDLVERFEEQREDYRSGQYNEAQLREEFLNPLFAALGWDVYNRKGYAEAYKEVIHGEDGAGQDGDPAADRRHRPADRPARLRTLRPDRRRNRYRGRGDRTKRVRTSQKHRNS